MKNGRATTSSILVWSVRLLAAIGGLAMMSTGECQILFVMVFLSFFLLGIKIENFPVLSRAMSVVQPFLATIVFAVGVLDFLYLSNSFLLSVAHFLLCIQGLRLLVLRTNRENMGSVLLSSLMVLSASTLAVEWSYFFFLFTFLFAVVWTLMIYTILEESQMNGTPSRSFLRQESLVWKKMMPAVRSSTLAAFFLAVSCCAFVFISFPRFNFQGFRGQFLQPVHKTGFTSQVDLGRSGKIFSDDSVVMRVEINPKDRERWSGYIRGQALEMFDGHVWKKSPAAPERIFAGSRGDIRIPIKDESPGELLRQSIYLESMDSPLLFAVARPAMFAVDRPFLDVTPDGGVTRGYNDSWRLHYDVSSYLSQLDPMLRRIHRKRAPRHHPDIPPRLQRIFNADVSLRKPADNLLELPQDQVERLTTLAASITTNARNDLDKAERIADYLRKNFIYSLQPGSLKKGENPVGRFLFETKRGHCEYFAAAMCLLLWAQNIPARMATGFLSREWNSRGHYYVVRMKNAHAWVEAYLHPYGWIGFDPSPREVPEEFIGSDMMRRFSETMDYLNLRWNRYILSYDMERQVQIVKAVSQQSGLMSVRLGRLTGSGQKWMAWFFDKHLSFKRWESEKTRWGFFSTLASWTLVIICAVLLSGLLWRFFHREKGRVWFYPALVRFLEKNAGEKLSSRTLGEFYECVRGTLEDKQHDAEFLTREYYRLRFDPAARISTEEIHQIRSALARLI